MPIGVTLSALIKRLPSTQLSANLLFPALVALVGCYSPLLQLGHIFQFANCGALIQFVSY